MPELGPDDVPAVLQTGEEVLPREEAGLYRQLFPNGMLAALQGAGRGAMQGLDSLSGNYLRDYGDVLSGRERGWRALATLGTPMLGAGVGNAAQWIPRGGEAMLDYLAESRLVGAMPGRYQIPTARVMAAGRDAALGAAEVGEGALNGAEAYTWGQRAAPMRYDDRSGAVVDAQGRSWYHDGGTVLEPGGALRPVDYVPDFDEDSLYWHHRGELAGGGVQQPDGSISTLYQAAIPGPGGRTYNVPTVWDGQILTTGEAADRAAGQGWRFPSYATPDAADLAYEARVHPRAAADLPIYRELHDPFPTAAELRGRELMAPGRDAITPLLGGGGGLEPSSYDPSRSFRENALDPRGINNAMAIALGFAGGGMTAKAPRPQLTVEEFEKRILEHQAFKQKFAEAFEKDPRLELTRGDHTFFASPNIGSGAPWRLTSFHAGEPTGHMEFNNLEQLAQEVWGLSGRYTAKGSVRDALGALWRDESGSVPLTGEGRNNMLKRIEQLTGESLEERLGGRVPGMPRRSFSEIQAADKGELAALEPRSRYDVLPEPIRGYQGSPAEFLAHDDAYLGTGQGAASYSPGHYFGQARAVGERYQRELSQSKDWPTSTGGKVPDWVGAELNRAMPIDPAEAAKTRATFPNLEARWHETVDKLLDDFRARVAETEARAADPNGVQPWQHADNLPNLRGIVQSLEDLKSGKATLKPRGHLYESDLYLNRDRVLDWDKPLSDQSEWVRENLTAKALGLKPQTFDNGNSGLVTDAGKPVGYLVSKGKPRTADELPWDKKQRGIDVWHALKEAYGEEAAQKKLRELGFEGLQYFDQVSRGGRDGTRNFVVYDPNLIDNVARSGQPLAPGGRNFLRNLIPIEGEPEF